MRQDAELSELKRQIERLAKGAARRIPEGLGRRIGQIARARIAAGQTRTSLTDELGISSATLNRVLEIPVPEQRSEPPGDHGFVRVDPVADLRGARISLPGGAVIEGLSFDEVVAFALEMR